MMKEKITCSLVTPTYNWPQALELLLLSVKTQTVLPQEVIIADDGSKPETTQLIKKFQENFPVPIIHVWHEDKGNQKPAIMNKAIAESSCNYIVEIDGDIIMHKDFIKDHLHYAQKGFYLFGSRVNIQQNIIETIFKNKIIKFNYFSKGIKKRNRTLRLPFMMNFEKPQDKISKKLRGCNMSFWKEDFIKVNGFNEELFGWGVDDSELIQRLHNLGIKGKRLKHVALTYHIYHKEQDKSHISQNDALEDFARENKIISIQKGINQYL